MTTKPEDIARLGRAVRDRRTELGMTQDDVGRAGGPSDVTVRGIENVTARKVYATTLGKLDTALQWEPGTAAAHLHGVAEQVVSPAPAPVLLHDASDTALLAEIARRFDLTRSHRERTIRDPAPIDRDVPLADRSVSDGATTYPAEHWKLAASKGPRRMEEADRRAAAAGEESQDPGTDEPA